MRKFQRKRLSNNENKFLEKSKKKSKSKIKKKKIEQFIWLVQVSLGKEFDVTNINTE